MSDAGPSRAEASEETPLLQDDASTTTGTAPRYSNNDVEARRAATADERQASLARVDKVLKILFASTISTGIATLAFSIALFVLGQYGQERFGYYDDIASSYQWPFFWQIVLAIVLSGTNLARMSHRSRPLPALINMIIFVLSGFYILICTVDILTWTNALFGSLCRSDLDDPDPRWGRHYPGSLKECRDWEPKYQAVAWVWICLELIMGLLMVTIAAACLVRVYKLRVQTGSDGEGQRTGSRWTMPAGQVSFEVSVYWGAPSTRGEGRPRQVEGVDERHDA